MFKTITKGCEPTRGSKYSACVDLRAAEDVIICAGETKIIGLGVKIDLEQIKCHPQFNREIWDFDKADDDFETEFMQDEFDKFLSSHYIQLMLRSSLGEKGLILPNGVGVIDLDYQDELKMILHNPIKLIDYDVEENTMYQYGNSHLSELGMMEQYHIKKGDRIAQATLIEHKGYLFGIDTDNERTGGIGSTGR